MSSSKIVLKSSDEETFEVEVAVVLESQVIKDGVELCGVDGVFPVPNVTSKILAKIIEYCKKHFEANGGSAGTARTDDRVTEEELKSWDADFVKVDQATLCDLILAADYLNIKTLLDLTRSTRSTVADMIKGKTPEEEEEEEEEEDEEWALEWEEEHQWALE